MTAPTATETLGVILRGIRTARPSDSDARVAEQVARELQAAGLLIVRDDPHHLVELTDTGWTLQHPPRCLLSGRLFACPTNRAVSALMAECDPGLRGWFAVTLDRDDQPVLDECEDPR